MNYSRITIIFLLCIVWFNTYAGITTYNSGPVKVNNYLSVSGSPIVITLQDDQYHYINNNLYGTHQFINHSIKDFVSLQYTGSLDQVYNPFTVTVNYTVDAWDTLNNPLSKTGTLTINYNPVTKQLETYRSEAELDWGDSLVVHINSVTYSGTVPGDVELTSRIVVDRYWQLSPIGTQAQSPAIVATGNSIKNTLNLAWSYLQGAESYDLEWVFVSAYVPSGTPDFTQATRINTTEQTYNINLAYDVGTIYYRVRGVGYMLPSDTERKEAIWSPTQSYAVSDIDQSRNWTYSATYAEQGKRKEVMQFFDGTTRMRQAVTENNTDSIALISETIYDYEGRAGVTTLPTPDSVDSKKLGFYKWLNLNTSGKPYSRKDFNIETEALCIGFQPMGLSTINGSGNYYSNQNPLTASVNPSSGVNLTIPDAGDPSTSYSQGTYPFTETLYNSEGKVTEQAGPGLTLREGAGHTTQYFYADALQSDLDKIFGNEAGDATHYQEKMTSDQNGQVSISYTDMSGKVVATSLIGPGPLQMDNLVELNGSLQPYTSDLGSYNSFIVPDDAMEFSPAMAFLAKATYPAQYQFSYNFNPSAFSISCIPFSTVVGYDFTFSIYDECGNIVAPTGITITPTPSSPTTVSTFGGVIVITNLQSAVSINFNVAFPSLGVYYISKKLSLDQNAFNTAIAAYTAAYPGGCTGFTYAQQQLADSTGVNTNGCLTCTSGCGTPDTINQCTTLYHIMETDMSPGGQYFDNRKASDDVNQPYNNAWLDSMIYVDAILHVGATTPANSGLNLYLSSHCLPNAAPFATWDDVRANWQPCFADFMVTLDPEYCRYKTCRALEEYSPTPDVTNSSLNFDQTLAQNNTYAYATTNPVSGSYIPYLNTSGCVGSNMDFNDPFFMTIDLGDKSNMDAQVCSNYNSTGLPMWTYATNTATAVYGLSVTNDEIYQTFLGYYESAKQGYIASWELANVGSGLCQSFCDQGLANNGQPTGVIGNTGTACNTSVSLADTGFLMRYPDDQGYFSNLANNMSNPVTNASTISSYSSGASDYNNDLCNIASRTHIYNPTINCILVNTANFYKDTLNINVYVQQGGPSGPIYEITCVPAVIPIATLPNAPLQSCFILPPMYTVLQNIANAINNSTCNPTGFSATVTYYPFGTPSSDPALNIFAPASMGGAANTGVPSTGFTMWFTDAYGDVFSGIGDYSPGGNRCIFDSGVTVTPCSNPPQGTIPTCLCTQLGQLQQSYNALILDASIPNTETFDEYAVCTLDTAYGLGSLALNGAEIEAWVSNCETSDNASPLDMSGNPAVPTKLNCNPAPPCLEDSYNIADYDASVAYSQEVTAATIAFEGQYEAAAYNSIDGYSETINTTASTWENHYTLYYYDQAGNLARTVPPAGVAFLSQTQVNTVEANRAGSLYPSHTKVTDYNYNSLNSVVYENHPSDEGVINHWYDQANRLRLTQNSLQASSSSSAPNYSYTLYDSQDRIVEVGQSNELYTSPPSSPFYQGVNDETFPSAPNTVQVTHTYYDAIFPGSTLALQHQFDNGGQHTLRSRVATVTYSAVRSTNPAVYDNATHYSYDELGYVNNLVQENTDLAFANTATLLQQYKKIRYKYDLISGNVDMAVYQPGQWDRFIHKYEYDADNRLTNAYTSIDSMVWDQDAKYFYYLHGPLGRMEIGQDKVQGIDYAYTLQGWLKGVNSNVLSQATDIGQDGAPLTNNRYLPLHTGIHSNVAQDAYGFTLGYFKNYTPGDVYNSDYNSIDQHVGDPASSFYTNNITNNAAEDLFNGNIKQMSVAMTDMYNNSMSLLDNHYRYDQINRITQDLPYYNSVSNTNYASGTNSGFYESGYTYDPDGNIMSLNRYNNLGTQIDNMAYTYQALPTSNLLDNVANPLGTSIPAGQAAGNYTYDLIGELTQDNQGNIAGVNWSVRGKILYVTGTGNEPDIQYTYDATGNNIEKLVKPRVSGVLSTQGSWVYTYYVRDAGGNIMAIYNRSFVIPSGGTGGGGSGSPSENFSLAENPIYGSKRIGELDHNVPLWGINFSVSGYNTDGTLIMTGITPVTLNPPVLYARALGFKNYELQDHLDNVLMTVSDRKLPIGAVGGPVSYFTADVMTSSDYYPFGEIISTRNTAADDYRFAYNGKEKEDEIYGQANAYNYGMRMYDARIGRFMGVDPLIRNYPMLTPFQYSSCNPIMNVDIDGQEGTSTVATFGLTAIFNFSTTKVTYSFNIFAAVGGAAMESSKMGGFAGINVITGVTANANVSAGVTVTDGTSKLNYSYNVGVMAGEGNPLNLATFAVSTFAGGVANPSDFKPSISKNFKPGTIYGPAPTGNDFTGLGATYGGGSSSSASSLNNFKITGTLGMGVRAQSPASTGLYSYSTSSLSETWTAQELGINASWDPFNNNLSFGGYDLTSKATVTGSNTGGSIFGGTTSNQLNNANGYQFQLNFGLGSENPVNAAIGYSQDAGAKEGIGLQYNINKQPSGAAGTINASVSGGGPTGNLPTVTNQ